MVKATVNFSKPFYLTGWIILFFGIGAMLVLNSRFKAKSEIPTAPSVEKVLPEFADAVFKEYVKGDVTWEIKAKRVIADGSIYHLTGVEAKLNCGDKVLELRADSAVYDRANGKIELSGKVSGGLK